MRLSDEVFWSLTLDLFLRLMDRHRDAERMQNYRIGTLAATMANFSFSPPKKALGWQAFFPDPKPAQTEDEMLAAFDMWARLSTGQEGEDGPVSE